MTPARVGLIFATYLLGSVPTGYWLGKMWKGIDIREHGSGNLGATNVYRVLGSGPAIFTFTFDCVKGLVPVLVSKRLFPHELELAILTGLAAILGHTTSVFVRFRGGKGMATSTGVFAALLPVPSLIAITVFVAVTGVTHFVSLGSILGALTMVAASFICSAPPPLIWTTCAVAIFVIWKHRSNIRRLLQGNENRLEWGRKTG